MLIKNLKGTTTASNQEIAVLIQAAWHQKVLQIKSVHKRQM